jgi:hypothetical protein
MPQSSFDPQMPVCPSEEEVTFVSGRDERSFGADAYVVRFGVRGFLSTLPLLAFWTGLLVWSLARPHGTIAAVVMWLIELSLLFYSAHALVKAVRRPVVFAVHSFGVYFGSGEVPEDVPWSRVMAIEFFTESHVQGNRSRTYRCVGVRARGTRQVRRAGNGPAADPELPVSVKHLTKAGGPDLISGADGTIRWAYRRMEGWRVNRSRLAEALGRHAPAVPVVRGRDWPASLAWTGARVVRKADDR